MSQDRSKQIVTLSGVVFVLLLGAVSPTFGLTEGGHKSVQNEKNTNGFFPSEQKWFDEGTAKTVFAPELNKAESPDVGFYQERKPREELEDDSFALNPSPDKTKKDFRGASQDDIVATFGDPEKDAALTPVENAPTPFRAMMAAMDAGQEDLAYRYARQYVRHIRNLQNRTRSVNEFTSLALEREGVVPPSANKTNPYRYLLEKDLGDEESIEEMSSSDGKDQDPRIAALIKRAAKDDAKTKGKFPVDPNGEVDVLFFFTLGDNASMTAARAVQSLTNAVSSSGRSTVRAYTLKPVSEEAISVFKSTSQISYPIQNGQALAMRIGVRSSPTVVFVARNTGEMFRLEDGFDFSNMSATIQKMGGGVSEN